jgi:S-adenosylmethionine-diacylgycerolhomoserine-N-methlytransferase
MNISKPQSDSQSTVNTTNKALQQYYKLHSRIYDATRWSFLFGRRTIVTQAAAITNPEHILEVGCGTGKNLAHLANIFPKSQITGVDVSSDMLGVAKRKLAYAGNRINLVRQPYPFPTASAQKYDLILFAYALSMFNPGWESAIRAAMEDLNEGGVLAVVDFHHSSFTGFRRWMGVNHVRMEAHLLPFLESQADKASCEIRRAYGGLWEYVLFLGRKHP